MKAKWESFQMICDHTFQIDIRKGLCCTNRLMVRGPLSPDGLIPRLQ